VPDAKQGEAVMALVALKPACAAKCASRTSSPGRANAMAVYKAPRIVEFIDALPKSGTGKILWRELQEAHRAAAQETKHEHVPPRPSTSSGAAHHRPRHAGQPRRAQRTHRSGQGRAGAGDRAGQGRRRDPRRGAHRRQRCVLRRRRPARHGGRRPAAKRWPARAHARHARDPARADDAGPAVVAAVDGAAYGAGFSLALAADFVLVTPRARFCMVFMRVGLVPDCGATYTLPRVVGAQRARELFLSAREVDAQEALTLGIAMERHEPAQLLPRALALADSFAGASPLAVSLVKRMGQDPGAMEAAFEAEANAQALCFQTTPHREAVQRFLDKQPLAFQWPTNQE
jgi:enoyl-CoA hydratase/carnithine racemase